jgi:hypothetical protein
MNLFEVLHWLVEGNKFAAPAEKQLIHEAIGKLEGKPPAAPAQPGAAEDQAAEVPAQTEGNEIFKEA